MRQSETISDSQFDEWSTFGLQIDLKAECLKMEFTFKLHSITISSCLSSAHCVYNQTKWPEINQLACATLQLQGHSCKIGNMRLLGTAENENCQFNAIWYFSLLFTLQQYIESRKYDWQPYCTFDQTSVPHYWKFHVPRRSTKYYVVGFAR